MVRSYIRSKNKRIEKDLSWRVLHDADFTLPMPFQLTLVDSNNILLCEKIIRLVPRKRMVVFAKWGLHSVVAKLFFNRKEAKQACYRDLRGVKVLLQANVPTPRLLYEGAVAGQEQIQVIILEEIRDAKNLAEIWRSRNTIADVFSLMRAVTIEIATQHVLGILQRDLHLKNFLITHQGLYSLDGSKITKYENPITKKLSLRYLALFFVQLGVGTAELCQELFKVYAKSRGWIIKKIDLKYLDTEITRIRKDLSDRYMKKIFRDCTLFKKISTFNKNIMYDREYKSAEFINFLQNPEKVFLSPTTQLLKEGKSSTVIKISMDGRNLVVKRYNLKNKWHGLRRCLRKTRAYSGWRLGQHLYMAGVPTAKPVAFIENHFLGFRGKSYFVMEYLAGPPAQDFFARYEPNNAHFIKVAERIILLFKNLRELRITHGDLKASNILIHQNQPSLIDFDGMREYIFLRKFEKVFAEELKRFMKNWQDSPEIYRLFSRLIQGNAGELSSE